MKKKKLLKIAIILLIICITAGIAALILNAYIKNHTKGRIIDAPEAAKLNDVDCILVLGCGVNPDGSLSYMLRDRLNLAYDVYTLGTSDKILMSGDHGKTDYNEVRAMKNYMMNQGVTEESDIFMDHAGFSTYESLYRAKEIFAISESTKSEVERMKAKGVQKTVRALVVGIPNVGKSTFINRIAGESRTKVGDRPGVTKGTQWVRVTPYLELLDSPGLLWPKLEDQTAARHLAFLGSINDEILELEELALQLLQELRNLCPEELSARYKKIDRETPDENLLHAVCQSRGFLIKGGELDTERAARVLLDEFRGGKIAHVTLERPIAKEDEAERYGAKE